MKQFNLPHADEYVKKNRRKTIGLRMLTVASAVVVFITTYMLILPAITMERETICGKEEHTHTEACYKMETSSELLCTNSPAFHQHTESCFDEAGFLICGETEHVHDESCYAKPEKVLVCEKEEHVHTEGCYAEKKAENHTGNQTDTVADDAGKEALSGETKAEPADVKEPVVLDDDHIKGAKLFYRDKKSTNEKDWIEITKDTTNIPGDASVKLEVSYQDIEIDSLLASGGRMVYELPSLLKNPQATGVITTAGGTETIGSIETRQNQAMITFYEEWLQKQEDGGSDVISGDFYVTAQFDLSNVGGDNKGQLVIGDVTIDIDFQDDVHASSSDVKIEKTTPVRVTEEENGNYLEYTLTVTVPEGTTAVPEVRVEDSVTAGARWIESYDISQSKIPDGTEVKIIGKTDNSAGKLQWTIGEMQPGETKSLTYRVKLKDGYTGSVVQSESTITNEADVYSKTYERGDAVTHFTPKAEMTMSKKSSQYTPDEDGGGTITYTIWVKALDTNTYTLKNSRIEDSFSNPTNPTSPEIRNYLELDENSFKLYKGGQKDQNGIAGLGELISEAGTYNPHEGQLNPEIHPETDSFTFYVGDMKPGECKTLIYTVKVGEEVFTLGNEAVQIHNRALLFPDDTRSGGGTQYTAYSCNTETGRKVWDRKLNGEEQQSDLSIAIPDGDDVFDTPGNKAETSPSEFTVMAGSFQYQVVVNEAGDWDVSSSALEDTLGNYLVFNGYMRVDAFDVTAPPNAGQTDAEAVAGLKGQTPVQTVWLNVDGQQSFQFQPTDLGLSGKKACLLTYYARPNNLGENASVVVRNDFHISGTVTGPGGAVVTLKPIQVTTSVTVQGQNRYGAEKQSWYYERPQTAGTAGDWSKGAMYWAIKVSGSGVSSGVQLKDIPGTDSYIRTDSVAAVYKGVLQEDWVNTYKSFSELDKAGLERLKGNALSGEEAPEGADYHWIKDGNTAKVMFQKAIPLEEAEGEALYIIIKTEPDKLPTGKRDTKDYTNALQSSGDNGNTWSDENTATETLYGSDGCFKETGGGYTFDGTKWTKISEGKGEVGKIVTLKGLKPGTYVEWRLHVNYDGGMSGTVQVTDQLPEGVEPVYVRYFWMGSDYNNTTLPRPTTPVISDLEGNNSWKKMELTNGGDGQMSGQSLTCISYYNSVTRQIRWNVENVAPGGAKDARAVEFQVLCRLKDDALLTGGQSTYINQFEAVDEHGVKGDDTADINITKNTLAKKGTYNAQTNGGIYPFEINVNPIGEDLVSGADTITLVDELSSTLILDTSSIVVKNTKTGEIVDGWTSSIEPAENGQVLKLVLPDNQPLTITYHTTINAAPGQEIAISNVAHWEGYTSPEGGNVSEGSFHYTAGGTAGADARPSFKLKKSDQADVQKYLEGAVFKLEKVELKNGEFESVSETGKVSDTQTTDEQGMAVFSATSGDRWMEFNTIYRLTEIEAPDGFVLDSTPYYFAIAKKMEVPEGGEPKYPEELEEWKGQNVHIHYNGAEYTYQAYNHKGEAAVEKVFQNFDGTAVAPGHEPNGSFRFGLFEEVQNGESAAVPLQTLTIQYLDGQKTYKRGDVTVQKPNFINLELGKTYYIYELDDRNCPIPNGTMATSDGRTFTVSYQPEGNGVTPNAENQKADSLLKIVVTNKEKPFYLPQTGGVGTHWYILGGALLAAAAFILLYRRIKAERRA